MQARPALQSARRAQLSPSAPNAELLVPPPAPALAVFTQKPLMQPRPAPQSAVRPQDSPTLLPAAGGVVVFSSSLPQPAIAITPARIVPHKLGKCEIFMDSPLSERPKRSVRKRRAIR